MLTKLQNKRSNYDHEKWSVDREKHERILSKICTYPHIFRADQKSTSRKRNPQSYAVTDIPSFSEGLKLPQPSARKRTKSVRRQFHTAGDVEGPKALLFETSTRIQGQEYFVEISRTKVHMLICAFSIQGAREHQLKVPIKEAYRLIKECRNRFERLVRLIYFKYGTILL